MALLERFKKARTIQLYLRRCPALLRKRYGADAEYSPARILTTLRVHRLPTDHAEYACAMFAGLEPFVAWAQAAARTTEGVAERSAHPYRAAARVVATPARDQCIARYVALRREVADRYNAGSHRFIPQVHTLPEQWVPLTNERAIGPLAWLV